MCHMDKAETLDLEDLPHHGGELHLFREVYRTYQVLLAGFARATGMQASRFAVMRLLVGPEADLGVTDIARRLGTDRAAVTRILQDLEREGLVRRRSDKRDGRRTYIALTPQGREAIERVHEGLHELEHELAPVLGAREMREAAVTLAKLRGFLDGRR